MKKISKQKSIIFISGHFNVLHSGHLRLFKKAKELADYLIVAVESNKIAGESSHFDEKLRLEAIKEISLIDKCFIMKKDLVKTLDDIRPDFVLKGKEFEGRFNIESEILKKNGGKLIFNSGDTTLASLDVLKKQFKLESFVEPVPNKYVVDHKISVKKLNTIINKFKKANVAIFGDVIVDKYVDCDAIGMSQEDPTIVITPIDEKKFIGGAGIVAMHAKKLGANVDFYSVIGNDVEAKLVKKSLIKHHVNEFIYLDITRPTNIKTRFRAYTKTLLRVSEIKMHNISDDLQNKIFKRFQRNIKKYNLVVFSDFNYGVLPQKLILQISKLCKIHNIKMIADSQSSSQIGDISRFRGMDLITPTEREARLATRNSQDGLVVMTDLLRLQSDVNDILLTLGENGLLIHTYNKQNDSFSTDTLPALNKNPLDVSGAGDCLLISSGLSIISGASIWEAAVIGSFAASIQVSYQGNKPISAELLKRKIKL